MNQNQKPPRIPFNRPYLTGQETTYIEDAVASGHISGNGKYTKLCQQFFEQQFGFGKSLLTTSCTDALEMAALLCDIGPGDEVIMPSYTFVSTANAFVLRGATIVFADSRKDHPGIDEATLEELITPRTKAIVPVHYAGVACDMDAIISVAEKHGIFVIEDAAQAIDSYYTSGDGVKRPLGSLGHAGAFSFHETKNIISGEGGMLAVNHPEWLSRAEIIWEKGTNRSAFFRGEIDKYGWIDVGSSFLPSEVVAAFLWAQLENLEKIQQERKRIWNLYEAGLKDWAGQHGFRLPVIPDYASKNGHLFYMVANDLVLRTSFIAHMKEANIGAVFHYLPLHQSPYYADKHDGRNLPMAEHYSNCLVRLPLFYGLNPERVIDAVSTFKP